MSSRRLPDIDRLLATQVNESTITVGREALMDCLSRSSPFAGHLDQIQMSTKAKVLYVNADDGLGDFEDRMAVSTTGDDKKLMFRRSYLISILRCVDDESVVLNLGQLGAKKPALFISSPLAPGASYVLGAQ